MNYKTITRRPLYRPEIGLPGGLVNQETAGIKIAVEAAIDRCELQHTVVRISYTGGIVLCVTLAPNHFLRSRVSQYLHRASEHHALKAFGIAKIDASLRVGLVLSHTYGEGVGRKVEGFDALTFTWLQHGLGPGKTVLVDR